MATPATSISSPGVTRTPSRGVSTWAVTAALSKRTVTVVRREDLPPAASNHHW